jgi:hypothetical protein
VLSRWGVGSTQLEDPTTALLPPATRGFRGAVIGQLVHFNSQKAICKPRESKIGVNP